MRHVDITKPKMMKYGYELAEVIVTVSGNNFGDQVLELKKYNTDIPMVSHTGKTYKASGYEIIAADSNSEGCHLSEKEIKAWAKNILKKS